ncbi:MAG: pyridoxal phosphate-dependent aminotransferase [Acidobacteria bacterium]|nr:pyridoxal phosphate-dependent aminotransferase [Acidobacteriota bacterium]
MFANAPYMEWAKTHARVAWDLTGSNLLPCTLDDLPEARDVLELWGPNDEGYIPLVEAIARHAGVAADRVALATGASGANFLVCAALLDRGDDVLVERPGYDPLIAAAAMQGARILRFDRRFEDGFALDPGAVRAAMTPRTRLVIVTNTHNPSGVAASREALAEIGRIADERGARVLVDEVYLDAADLAGETPAATRSEVFISTSSLTKAYGLAGLRCGWVIAAPEVVHRIRRTRDVVDGIGAFPAERIAAVAFAHLDRLRARARIILARNGSAVRTFLRSRPEFEWIDPPAGSVVFPRLRGVADAEPFIRRLLSDYETAVVPGRFFEAPAHFRIAFGGKPDILAGGLERIGRACDTLGLPPAPTPVSSSSCASRRR